MFIALLVKIILVGLFFVSIAALGVAMMRMLRHKGNNEEMAKALTIRIGASIGLFLLLMLAYATGLITPNNVNF
jgi:hypothetical protein